MWVPLSDPISKGGETVEKDYLFQSPNPKVWRTLRACLAMVRRVRRFCRLTLL